MDKKLDDPPQILFIKKTLKDIKIFFDTIAEKVAKNLNEQGYKIGLSKKKLRVITKKDVKIISVILTITIALIILIPLIQIYSTAFKEIIILVSTLVICISLSWFLYEKEKKNSETGKCKEEKKPEEVMPDTNSGKIKYLSKKYQVERFIVQDIFDNWREEKGILQDGQRVKFFVQYNWVEIEQRVINYKKNLPEEKQEYGKEKLATTIFKEKAEQAKYRVDMAEAEEVIAKIKKRTFALFEKPKKEMTAGEKLRERVRRTQEILKVVDELKEGMPPEQQEMLEAEAYRLTEKIKEWG